MRDVRFKIDAATGCWNCTSHAQTVSGYPRGCVDGYQTTLHRQLYMQTHNIRSMPRETQVMHICDNKQCINPAHLHTGTHDDNMREAVERDRVVFGEDHHFAKLNEIKVRAIMQSSETDKVLSQRYNVSPAAIWCVRNGKSWNRITGLVRS